MSAPKFLFDVHLSKEAARQLLRRGVDVVHAVDLGMKDAPDEQILVYATDNRRVLVSCDDDFELYHIQRQQIEREHAGIVIFDMEDICKHIGRIVKEVEFLAQAADYEIDLYNQLWRVKR